MTAVLGLAVPAAAETFVSSDGVLSLELPDDGWVEIVDPNKWIALSDGANVITAEHYANGEKLPDMTVADDHYVNVYQAVVSTQNEVFVITGQLANTEKMQELCEAILSAKVLKYDTKIAVKKEAAADASEFSLVAMDKTMYATTVINIRSGCSTDDQILGGVAPGEAIKVTGSVQRNGQDFGWYQVSYNGGTGYVSASFVSDTAPSTSSNTSSIVFTSKAKTVYDKNGNVVTIYEATDGAWYDNKGNKYSEADEYSFAKADGTVFSVIKPQTSSGAYAVGSAFTVYWQNGNATTLTQYSDGYYYADSGVRYTLSSDGVYYGADGTNLYSSAPSLVEDNTEQHYLIRQEDGKEVIVSAGGGAYYDSEGTEYSWVDETTMMDFFGHLYNVRW